MKKHIIIYFLLLAVLSLKAQKQDSLVYQTITDFRLDTTAFVRYNFIDRAKQYEGKTFVKLLEDLNIKPMIMGIGYSFSDEGKRLFSGIRLYIPSNNDGRCYIHLSWIEPMPMPVEAERLLRKYGMYMWLDDYITLFADNRIAYISAGVPEY